MYQQGTLVRVWDAKNGQQLHELRRGMDPADICSICFSPSSKWLSVASDKGTVHVFILQGNDSPAPAMNATSMGRGGLEGLSFPFNPPLSAGTMTGVAPAENPKSRQAQPSTCIVHSSNCLLAPVFRSLAACFQSTSILSGVLLNFRHSLLASVATGTNMADLLPSFHQDYVIAHLDMMIKLLLQCPCMV